MFKNIMPNNLPTIGVDVGGTKISAGWVESNKLIKSFTSPTPAKEEKEKVLDAIVSTIKALDIKEFLGIGVGIPGLIDTKNGIVYNAHNIPSLTHLSLKLELESVFHREVAINNDANCFVLGANNYGEGQQFNSLIGLTLGTGLGGGLILDGELYEGVNSGAGEFGFLPYKDGILEQYCSGQFFQRQYGITGKEASRLAIAGDTEALEMFSQFGHHLGEGIKMITHTFAPEAVMLGGSISGNFNLFKKSMWEAIRNFPYNHVIDNLKIIPATGPEIALVGAASLISKQKLSLKKLRINV